MAKCEHGVYIPEGDDIAWFCQLCNIFFPELPWAHRELHFPLYASGLDKHRQRSTRVPGSCPDCNSQIWAEVTKGYRECGECGAIFKAPRGRHIAEQEVVCLDSI